MLRVPNDTIDATELRLLSSILALVLDEQPGQAAAALDTLRRKAAHSRITGGALKNLFEHVSAQAVATPPPAPGIEARRLQRELEAATVQASRFAAENAALQHSLAYAERQLARYDAGELAQRRELAGIARAAPPEAPARRHGAIGLIGGALFALMAMLLAHDQSSGAGFLRRAHPLAQAALRQPAADRVVPGLGLVRRD